MLNFITLQGRLCADPDLRRTNNGTPVASFTLAVERDFKNENGNREADFIPVVCWRNLAEHCEKWFSKGQMAVVSGRLQIRQYTDKDGNKRMITEVVADKIHFCGSKSNRDEDDYARAEREGKAGHYEAKAPVPVEVDEDEGDLPF